MKRGKMNKRAIAGLLVQTLLIIIAIIAVTLLMMRLFGYWKERGEVQEVKSKLLTEEIKIDFVEGSLISPSLVNVSIILKSGEEFSNNTVIKEITPKSTDIFLLSDVSGSMADCVVNAAIKSCKYKCTFNSSTCVGTWTYIECNAPSNNVSNCFGDVCSKNAAILLGSNTSFFSTTYGRYRCSYYYNYSTCATSWSKNCTMPPNSSCSGDFCQTNQPSCNLNGTTMTNYTVTTSNMCLQTKISISINASLGFIDAILSMAGNRLGIVPYSTAVSPYFNPLTSEPSLLKTKVNLWTANGNTCTCCAINKAVEQLNTSVNLRAIVLMTDGKTNVLCPEEGTNNALKDEMEAAKRAANQQITIYTVGFGADANKTDLQALAQVGGGEYYDASDASKLNEIFALIPQKIAEDNAIQSTFRSIYVVFSSKTESYSYRIDNPPEKLFESKKYSIVIPPGKLDEIIKIEVFPVGYTKSGKEIIGPALDSWPK